MPEMGSQYSSSSQTAECRQSPTKLGVSSYVARAPRDAEHIALVSIKKDFNQGYSQIESVRTLENNPPENIGV